MEVSDKDILEAVKWINTAVGKSLYKTAIEVGQYVLDRFFNGDIVLAMSKNPYKTYSYRKLQEHPKLKIHHNTLNQMVRIAAQEQFLLQNFADSELKLLTFSHRVELLKHEDKIDVARKCIEDGLSVRALRKEINRSKDKAQSDEMVLLNPTLNGH